MKFRRLLLGLTGAATLAVGSHVALADNATCQVDEPYCFERSAQQIPQSFTGITMPDIAVPLWLNQPTTQSNGDIQ